MDELVRGRRSAADRHLFALDVERSDSASLPYAHEPICIVAPAIWEGATMLDLLMLPVGVGLFALTIGYIAACDRL